MFLGYIRDVFCRPNANSNPADNRPLERTWTDRSIFSHFLNEQRKKFSFRSFFFSHRWKTVVERFETTIHRLNLKTSVFRCHKVGFLRTDVNVDAFFSSNVQVLSRRFRFRPIIQNRSRWRNFFFAEVQFELKSNQRQRFSFPLSFWSMEKKSHFSLVEIRTEIVVRCCRFESKAFFSSRPWTFYRNDKVCEKMTSSFHLLCSFLDSLSRTRKAHRIKEISCSKFVEWKYFVKRNSEEVNEMKIRECFSSCVCHRWKSLKSNEKK